MLPALSTRRIAFPTLSLSSDFHREVDGLFERFFGDIPGDSHGLTRGGNAPVGIWEDETHVYVEVEVPGFGRDDIEVVMRRGQLKIAGERKAGHENRSYWYNERTPGRFERLITLPDVVDADSIEAEMRDGILMVRLTKKPEAQPKKIAIRAG